MICNDFDVTKRDLILSQICHEGLFFVTPHISTHRPEIYRGEDFLRRLSEIDRIKIQAVKDYLSRYAATIENMRSLDELNSHIYQNKHNPGIGGRGYRNGSSGNVLSGGAASHVISSDSMQNYSQTQAERNKTIMRECENAIALLDVSRGKTILERRFLLLQPWDRIVFELSLSRDTCMTCYRATMIIMFDLMVSAGMIQPINE